MFRLSKFRKRKGQRALQTIWRGDTVSQSCVLGKAWLSQDPSEAICIQTHSFVQKIFLWDYNTNPSFRRAFHFSHLFSWVLAHRSLHDICAYESIELQDNLQSHTGNELSITNPNTTLATRSPHSKANPQTPLHRNSKEKVCLIYKVFVEQESWFRDQGGMLPIQYLINILKKKCYRSNSWWISQ